MATKITRDVLESYLHCKTKAHLKLAGQQGSASDYERLLVASRSEVRLTAIDMILERQPDNEVARGITLAADALRVGPSFVLDAALEVDLLWLNLDGLKRVDGASDLGRFHYVPMLFYEGRKVDKRHRLLLAIFGLLLSQIQGRTPAKGVVVGGHERTIASVSLNPVLREAERILRDVNEMARFGSLPELVLNNHCSVCEFRQRCHDRAMQEDNLSLLRGMGEKEITKLRRRGIFTVTQLSCTYRPRRTRKKSRRQTRGHSFALQALAVRENKTYVLGNPELPVSPVQIYFDLEGDPERVSAYLLGMIVEERGSERRFSYWADGMGQEEQILKSFLEVVEGYENCQLFCYGNFEVAFLKRMARAGWAQRIEPILGRTTNVLPIIYSSLYFPVYSNGLKAIGTHLGFRWSEPDASGLQCKVWRRQWEETHDEGLRRKIEAYNLEDCSALRTVARFIHAVGDGRGGKDGLGTEGESYPGYSRLVDHVVPYSRREWCKATFSLPDFAHINNLSYFDYQRDRVFVRSSERLRRAQLQARKRMGRKKVRLSGRFEIRCAECPTCKSGRLSEWHDGRLSRIVLDLGITATGIKRRFVKVASPRYRCIECRRTFAPPDFFRVDRHSHPLKSWAMYEHVAHRVSFKNLEESFSECFGLRVHSNEIQTFKHLMARYYEATFEQLRTKIVSGSLIHADETEVDIKGVGKGYVWVFTNLEEVIYLYKPSREGGFLHEFLDGFRGVLVSDFYAAYDSLPCVQQKCLIHLIRDFNHDVLSNPFDEELKALAADFGSLLKVVVNTIDRHGLSRRHLSKHGREVERFFESVSGRDFGSEVAQAYQKRFEKHRGKLFAFLDHDGVPWNNNNAEHAIKKFAYYREVADGLFSEGGLKDYLTLLSIYQTCVYKRVSCLKFLVSKERDIDRFCGTSRRDPGIPPYDLYPEGYVPSYRRHKARRDDASQSECPSSV